MNSCFYNLCSESIIFACIVVVSKCINMRSNKRALNSKNVGRPIENAPQEHGYQSDYKSHMYTTLGGPRTVDKVQIPLLSDDEVNWHTFHIPRPLPQGNIADKGLKQWWLSASADEKRKAWEEATGGGQVRGVTEDDADLRVIRGRLHELVVAFPVQFSTLLAEIRYRRDQMRYRRGKWRRKKVQVRDLIKGSKERHQSWFRGWGLNTPLAARVFHYSACFHVGVMAIAALVQLMFEIRELNSIFLTSDTEESDDRYKFNPVTSREPAVFAFSLILAATLVGIVGQYFKNHCLLRLYVVMFVAGIGLCVCGSWLEHDLAVGDGLGDFFKYEVNDYLHGGASTTLLQAQDKFRCCGYRGAWDFGPAILTNVKLKLPQSCCEQFVTQTPDCHVVKGHDIADFVHGQGCTIPVKNFLGHLHLSRMLMIPFMLFGALVHIVSIFNLHRTEHFFCCCSMSKCSSPNRVSVNQTLGELLLETIEEATTSIRPQSMSEFENEKVVGTIDYIRRRLGDTENLTDFIVCIVDLLHEIKVFQESELGARPEAEAIARVILGLRPKRFVSPSLIENNFERVLEVAESDVKIRTALARKDLLIRMNMQEVVESMSEQMANKLERLEHCSFIEFPLPRPMNGVRISEWRAVENNVMRRDKYSKADDDDLDPLDQEYLEHDRVLLLAAPKEPFSKFAQCCARLFPLYKLNEKEYLFLENGLFEPSMDLLSKIITEGQGILCDIRRKARFHKTILFRSPSEENGSSADLRKVDPNRSTMEMNDLDMEKVNAVLKKLCDLEAIQEELMERWVKEQLVGVDGEQSASGGVNS